MSRTLLSRLTTASRKALGVPIMLCIVSLLGGNPVFAQNVEPARRVAVLSLMGGSLSIVTHTPSTGTHLSQNEVEDRAVPNGIFDKAATAAADEAARKSDPTVVTILLSPQQPALAAIQDKMIDAQGFAAPPSLVNSLNELRATHLLLLTKHRDSAKLQGAQGFMGSGTLSGLGYYVDRHLHVKSADTGATALGFLAPFAYFKISLVDLNSGDVVKQRLVTVGSTIFPGDGPDPGDPWAVLDATQKADLLRDLVKRAVESNVTQIFDAKS